jgi:hypothetical protein
MSNELIAALITVGILIAMFVWSIVCDRACDGRYRSVPKSTPKPAGESAVSPIRERRSRYSA